MQLSALRAELMVGPPCRHHPPASSIRVIRSSMRVVDVVAKLRTLPRQPRACMLVSARRMTSRRTLDTETRI